MTTPEKEATVDEARMRRASGARKMVRLKRHTSSERAAWRKKARTGKAKAARKKYRRSSGFKALKRKNKRLGAGVEAEGTVVSETLDRVESILDNLDNGLALESRETATRAFASLALIADQLEEGFLALESDAEHVAVDYGRLAAQAERLAVGLDEGRDPNVELLNVRFGEMVASCMEGVETLLDLAEAEASEISEEDLDEEDFGLFDFTEAEIDAGMKKHGKEYKKAMMKDVLGNAVPGSED